MNYFRVTFLSIILITLSLASCSHSSNNSSWFSFFDSNETVWENMRDHFSLQANYNQADVKAQVQRYLHQRQYIAHISYNAKPYLYYVYHQTLEKNMPAEIALLPIIESNYNPFLFSHQGADGLWQFMPGTASGLGITINWWYDGRRDIIASTTAALDYLNYLHNIFHDWLLAIAAYDAGAGTIQTAIHHNQALKRPTDFWHLALPAETKAYVPKMLALAAIIDHNNTYHVPLAKIKDEPFFKAVIIQGQYGLDNLAQLTDISEATLRSLNPGFRRFATGNLDNYNLLLPRDHVRVFKNNLKKRANKKTITWQHQRVKPGNTLSGLAHHYNTTVDTLRSVNDLKSDILPLNKDLLIPKNNKNISMPYIRHSASVAEDHLPGPTKIMHTVNRYETLSSIATRYHVSIRNICFWNQLSGNTLLRPNQSLIIWQKHYSFRPSHFTYTVQPHDTIGVLAQRFGVSINQIELYNGLKNNIIRLDQTLKIPYHQTQYFKPKYHNQMVIHIVKPGDSLNKLAQYYHVSAKQLAAWSHINQHRILHIGQAIKVYITPS